VRSRDNEMPKKRKVKQTEKRSKKADDSKTFAFLATFLSIIGFLIVLLTKKDDKYVMFYARQSLVVFIAWVIAGILGWIPILGWILSVVVFVLWIFSWIYALSGKEKNTPLIGSIANKINL
jgi:uncharacterized membrane protein